MKVAVSYLGHEFVREFASIASFCIDCSYVREVLIDQFSLFTKGIRDIAELAWAICF